MTTTSSTRRFDPAKAGGLGPWLATAVGSSRVEIKSASRLAGGAVQDNWRLDVEVADGAKAGVQTWVLRTDAAARLSLSLDRAAEYDVIGVAHSHGVPVAEPIARCDDASIIGAAFFVQGWLTGSAQARRITRDPALAETGPRIAEALGRVLAGIHAVVPAHATLPGLPPVPAEPAKAEVARLRKSLDGAGEPRPALEYILAWLNEHAPPAADIVLVHGDYRTGNYMVDSGRLSGILDWEFAHWGDRHEDIGWLSARCWRFGNDDREAGGIASLDGFLAGYEAGAPGKVDRSLIAYWQIMAAAKWAAIAVLQGDRYRRGGEQRLELALTGLMAPEMEYDALSQILGMRGR